jgi:chromatin segregation and condensation protein Rec8/ScpA/Scc1 (kleisin family)
LLGQGDTVQAIHMFIMLLFLAIEKKVGLVQTEEFGDIRIAVTSNGSPGSD